MWAPVLQILYTDELLGALVSVQHGKTMEIGIVEGSQMDRNAKAGSVTCYRQPEPRIQTKATIHPQLKGYQRNGAGSEQ